MPVTVCNALCEKLLDLLSLQISGLLMIFLMKMTSLTKCHQRGSRCWVLIQHYLFFSLSPSVFLNNFGGSITCLVCDIEQSGSFLFSYFLYRSVKGAERPSLQPSSETVTALCWQCRQQIRCDEGCHAGASVCWIFRSVLENCRMKHSH